MKNSHSNSEKSKKFTSKDSSTLYYEHLKSCCDEFQKSKSHKIYYPNPDFFNSSSNWRARDLIHAALSVLLSIFVVVALIAAFLLAFAFLSYIWKFNKEFFTILYGAVALIGMNIVAYFASFRWHMRKPWFFLASMFVSIVAVCACLSIFFA